MAAADTDAAKDAIATIEESRKHIKSHTPDAKEPDVNDSGDTEIQNQKADTASNRISTNIARDESRKPDATGPGSGSAYDSVANLPMEYYHYYHGSNTDMGTLIEVIPITKFNRASVLLCLFPSYGWRYHCSSIWSSTVESSCYCWS